jgi:hypothetical protein
MADENHTVSVNVKRALYACDIALSRGYAPIAPRLLCSPYLDDHYPKAQKAWLSACDELWQWGASISEEMAAEIALAQNLGITVKVFNSIGIPKERWNRDIQFIGYTGRFPSLCSGKLTFSVDGQKRTTTTPVLHSTGGLQPHYAGTYKGEWEIIREDPAFSDFGPAEFTRLADVVNENVPHGCCGGCI